MWELGALEPCLEVLDSVQMGFQGTLNHRNKFSKCFRRSLDVLSGKIMLCVWERPHVWKFSTGRYADTSSNNFSIIMYDINVRNFIWNTLTANPGLSCRTCPRNTAFLPFGQFGLHVLVSKHSRCLILFEINMMLWICWCVCRSQPTCLYGGINSLTARTRLVLSFIPAESPKHSRNLL